MENIGKILVVDDEADICEFISYNLKKEGYQVWVANNGKEAIPIALKVKPDLILLDVMMPVMDGLEACRIIKSDPEFSKTFVVFLTARAEEYSEIEGFNAGADDYIAKPIKPKVLLTRLNDILRRKIKDADKTEDEQAANVPRWNDSTCNCRPPSFPELSSSGCNS